MLFQSNECDTTCARVFSLTTVIAEVRFAAPPTDFSDYDVSHLSDTRSRKNFGSISVIRQNTHLSAARMEGASKRLCGAGVQSRTRTIPVKQGLVRALQKDEYLKKILTLLLDA